ncbi:uncharacterized protein LOC128884208 isoform X2 [Hylaeus volcanicus]|uniref:uncharacterized protein LOC128884208 isoform X2 n=1 Tax=Hylaeus volcanicus TaxID=313075 RepID=UPI0023B828A3|nr:uncharacterized protein LOC128884208 isoform X2 [Hylaeus volcanicus]
MSFNIKTTNSSSISKNIKYQKVPLSPRDSDSEKNLNANETEGKKPYYLDNSPNNASPILDKENPVSLTSQSVPLTDATDENLPATTSRRLYCNFCDRVVLSSVELQSTIFSFFLAFLVFLFFGWLSIFIVPFLWSLLQTAVHFCPVCETVLLKLKRVSVLNFREQIITLRIGTCALVLTKRYLLGILSLVSFVFFLLTLRWYINATDFPVVIKNQPINATWTDFLEDCGYVVFQDSIFSCSCCCFILYCITPIMFVLRVKSYLGNPLRAEKLFLEKYEGKTIIWEGRMHHVEEGIFSKHFLYLDMDPPFYPRNNYRDIALIFGKHLSKEISNVEAGDKIQFESTLLELGRRGRPHLGILWNATVIARNSTLPPLMKGAPNPFILLQDIVRSPLLISS